ncbi:MAG TPA: hypothetical protein VHW23_27300 [Kofleriaceae bacterium]|jgi:hypothetical protein|nr:hypothetical protein [Kofleriaceae bacterium]
MTARRLFSLLTVILSAGAVSAVAAQPAGTTTGTSTTTTTTTKTKKAARPARGKGAKKAPLAPAKDAGSGAAAGSAAGAGEGSAVQMTEDPPPADISGTAENPDAPHTALDSDAPPAVQAVAAPVRPAGYPIEEALRPITLPQNLSEVSLAPHMQVSPVEASTALRARYGITPKVQLGLTYVLAGIFDDPATLQSRQGVHSGKAVGLDVTVMLQSWVGVQVGVPLYISPLAVSLAIGVPMKFTFVDKFAIGGLDDFLNIKLDRFAPTFYQEAQNAINANGTMTNTTQSAGELRVSLFGIYQYQPNFAIIGRTGIQMEDFATGKTDGCFGECLTTFISAGFHYAPRKFLDLGLSIGFDDLAHGGSFAPAGYLAFRI